MAGWQQEELMGRPRGAQCPMEASTRGTGVGVVLETSPWDRQHVQHSGWKWL